MSLLGRFGVYSLIGVISLMPLLVLPPMIGTLVDETLLGALGFAVYEAANTAQFTYLERLGVSLALTDQQIGLALLIASLAGIPGAFTIVFLGSRLGRMLPLSFGVGLGLLDHRRLHRARPGRVGAGQRNLYPGAGAFNVPAAACSGEFLAGRSQDDPSTTKQMEDNP